MSKDLITLDDHNENSVIRQSQPFEIKLNGIECPTCFNELTDIEPSLPKNGALTETSIKCFKCGYEGVRY